MSLPLIKRGLIALCLAAALVVPPTAAQAQPSAVGAQSALVVHAKKARAFTKSPRPSISGSPTVGAVLKVVRGAWKPKPVFSYRWQIDGNTVPGATRSSYTIRAQDAGSRVTVVVRAKKTGYRTTERTSRPVQVPAPPTPVPAPTSAPPAPAPTTAPPTPTPSTVPPAPVPTATPPVTTPPPSNVAIAGDGDYRVGITVAPGTYVTSTSTSSCYWERVTSFDGRTSSIIANDFASGQRIVTIKSSDYGVSFSHCGTWLRELDAPAAASVATGQYFVGSQIAPGLYLASPSSSGCYWALLRDFDGSSASIISNDYRAQAGAVYVQVGSAVRGFESSNCGSWTRVSS